MATKIDVTGLTLNPQENPDFATFINERTFEQPGLQELHNVITGVQMKQQIVYGGLLQDVGIADDGCARPNSGAQTSLTQRYAEPTRIGDTLVHCQAEVDSLFKAYYSKINNYKELFDISGTDEEMFIAARLEDAIAKSVMRNVWLGDLDAAQAGASTSGLINAGDVQYFSASNGIFKDIFAQVLAGDIERVDLSAQNGLTTKADQLGLAAGYAKEQFDAILDVADSRLRGDMNAKFYVSRSIFDNYKKYLRDTGEAFTLEYLMDGMATLTFDGYQVVNMETVWDKDLRAKFVDNTTNNAYYLPNRIIFTTPENLAVTTLNDNDMSELESWYNQDDRVNKMAFGYTLHSFVLEPYMMVAAY